MIQHEIIVVKPHIVQHTQYNTSWHNTKTATRYPNITSQAELDKWLETCGFGIGDYVTYARLPISHTSVMASVYRVVGRCTDFSTLTSQTYVPYAHKLLFLQYLETVSGPGSCSWNDVQNLRKLSEQEIKEVVVPYLDRIRNHSATQAG